MNLIRRIQQLELIYLMPNYLSLLGHILFICNVLTCRKADGYNRTCSVFFYLHAYGRNLFGLKIDIQIPSHYLMRRRGLTPPSQFLVQ